MDVDFVAKRRAAFADLQACIEHFSDKAARTAEGARSIDIRAKNLDVDVPASLLHSCAVYSCGAPSESAAQPEAPTDGAVLMRDAALVARRLCLLVVEANSAVRAEAEARGMSRGGLPITINGLNALHRAMQARVPPPLTWTAPPAPHLPSIAAWP